MAGCFNEGFNEGYNEGFNEGFYLFVKRDFWLELGFY